MVTEHGARTHVYDGKKPNPFHLEFMRKTERIPHDDLEPDVEPVAIEFDDLIWTRRYWSACSFPAR
ncbi:hypothetical protein PTKU64_88960 [Paraburkholderia terrae]|uniref:Uncharacterized protein n=1 Tax=Paraburkholderia terrae TaxID=311230 RepID=A0ABM7U258_9BURK|nr:hypothetical protein PTKU64_88960 [Paraburkholderia terrae]